MDWGAGLVPLWGMLMRCVSVIALRHWVLSLAFFFFCRFFILLSLCCWQDPLSPLPPACSAAKGGRRGDKQAQAWESGKSVAVNGARCERLFYFFSPPPPLLPFIVPLFLLTPFIHSFTHSLIRSLTCTQTRSSSILPSSPTLFFCLASFHSCTSIPLLGFNSPQSHLHSPASDLATD